ncbi:MAG: hypothetical protein WCE80_02535 [Acidimicrobiia bacterium]
MGLLGLFDETEAGLAMRRISQPMEWMVRTLSFSPSGSRSTISFAARRF